MRKERDRRGWGVEGVRPRLRHRLLTLYGRAGPGPEGGMARACGGAGESGREGWREFVRARATARERGDLDVEVDTALRGRDGRSARLSGRIAKEIVPRHLRGPLEDAPQVAVGSVLEVQEDAAAVEQRLLRQVPEIQVARHQRPSPAAVATPRRVTLPHGHTAQAHAHAHAHAHRRREGTGARTGHRVWPEEQDCRRRRWGWWSWTSCRTACQWLHPPASRQ